MRYVRYAFLATLAIVLISVSLANSAPATVQLMPGALAGPVGFNPSITLPMFLIILGGIVAGLVIGFVLEWMREYKHRKTASVKAREVRKLEREVGRLKDEKHKGKDEVLALLEEAR